jgi:transposase
MRVIRKRCLGLDVHKKQITAHLRIDRGPDTEPLAIREVFGTMPDELDRLVQWVVDHQVTDVVMESTSVYWMHLYDRLEPVTKVAVVNASHIKKVPGRKTDMIDAEWLAELHAHGLLRASFVPPKEIRELRQLTRYRTKLVALRTGARNRTIKLLERSGIKLSSVVSDVFGTTGRAILDGLAEGTLNPQQIAALAKGSLRNKVAELERAVRDSLSPTQREMLSFHLREYDSMDAQVLAIEQKLEEYFEQYESQVAAIDPIPGINPLAAITLLAETGVEMSVYRNEGHLAAMAGLAPGNSVSADRRRRISVRKGNVYLKRICVQIAWAAIRAKKSFFAARFRRLSRRIGRNKAIIAIAHQILVVVHKVLSTGRPFQDLGADFYDTKDKDKAVRRLTKRLAKFGYSVQLEPLTIAS